MSRILVTVENTDVTNVRLEELMLAQNQLRVIDAAYQDLKIDTPDWILEKMSEINTEINVRVRSELMRQLKAEKARKSALLPRDKKLEESEKRIADLENRLK